MRSSPHSTPAIASVRGVKREANASFRGLEWKDRWERAWL